MSTPPYRHKPMPCLTSCFLFIVGCITVFLFFYGVWCSVFPNPTHFPTFSATSIPSTSSFSTTSTPQAVKEQLDCPDSAQDPPNLTFYDDPDLSYSVEKPMKNWDEKRKLWLEQHPWFANGVRDLVLMLSGSQPAACKNPIGDHMLLRFFKNKVDYCRIHGYDLYYNHASFPKMSKTWVKLPLVRSAMIAHPEVEWIWWVDSDAAFTDMEFRPPLERYKDYNFIIDGWADLLYEEKKWISVNSGIFFIRNCQWSMDFLDAWASMGPQTPHHAAWSKIHLETLNGMLFQEADDQSSLVYLMLKEKEKWTDKIHLEHEYILNGYWEVIVDTYENITEKHIEMEKEVRRLRRRHAEKASECHGVLRDRYLKLFKEADSDKEWKRPFITHFAGCSPCSGDHNPKYPGETCVNAMQRALNFADNQVLRSFGYIQIDPDSLAPLPFDYPA